MGAMPRFNGSIKTKGLPLACQKEVSWKTIEFSLSQLRPFLKGGEFLWLLSSFLLSEKSDQ